MATDDERFDLAAAFALAERAHAGQKDKTSGTPYIAHVMRVASTVIRVGGSAEQAQAALLHDAIEDGGACLWPEVERLGPAVTAIVKACSDAEPEERSDKAPWLERKAEHVEKLRAGPPAVPAEAYLVIAADKLDAVERTLDDVERQGNGFWTVVRFKGGRLGSVWYWRSMSDAVSHRLGEHPLAAELARRTAELAHCADLANQGIDSIPLGDLLELAIRSPYPDGIKPGQGAASAVHRDADDLDSQRRDP
jgi:hypothetical protein